MLHPGEKNSFLLSADGRSKCVAARALKEYLQVGHLFHVRQDSANYGSNILHIRMHTALSKNRKHMQTIIVCLEALRSMNAVILFLHGMLC